MDKQTHQQIIENEIEKAMDSLFPHGAGQAPHTRVRRWLDQIAQVAYQKGRNNALLGLMTSDDVAEEFGVSKRRARALIKNRHERFGVGMQVGRQWVVHRDELVNLEPDGKYRTDEED